MMWRVLILILLPALCMAQRKPFKVEGLIAPVLLSAAAGFSNGTHEALNYKYPRFKARFPGANDAFWYPHLSWRNKWKGGDPENWEQFPGSSSVFVATTDGYHASAKATRGFLVAAGCTITIGERLPWWHYALRIGASYLSFSLSSHLTYPQFYK